MKKRKLKPFVKGSIVGTLLLVCALGVGLLLNNQTASVSKVDSNFIYVNDYIFDSYYPVVNQDEKIIRPYSVDGVSISKNFYDVEATEEEIKRTN